MLLAISIGNSSTGFGLFPEPLHSTSLIVEKVPSRPGRTSGFYKKIAAGIIKETHENLPSCISAVVASVVPSQNRVMTDALRSFCKERPLYITAATTSGLSFAVEKPLGVGADRIANAVGAAGYNKGQPTAVADFGTATTITVVGPHHNLLGGAILPGVYLMQESLHSGTAKLPLVPLHAGEKALGKDTASAIISGIVYGTAGAVEKLLATIEKELKFKLKLVVTGGNAPLVSSFIKRPFIHRPHLTFEGLRLIYLMNMKPQRH